MQFQLNNEKAKESPEREEVVLPIKLPKAPKFGTMKRTLMDTNELFNPYMGGNKTVKDHFRLKSQPFSDRSG